MFGVSVCTLFFALKILFVCLFICLNRLRACERERFKTVDSGDDGCLCVFHVYRLLKADSLKLVGMANMCVFVCVTDDIRQPHGFFRSVHTFFHVFSFRCDGVYMPRSDRRLPSWGEWLLYYPTTVVVQHNIICSTY